MRTCHYNSNSNLIFLFLFELLSPCFLSAWPIWTIAPPYSNLDLHAIVSLATLSLSLVLSFLATNLPASCKRVNVAARAAAANQRYVCCPIQVGPQTRTPSAHRLQCLPRSHDQIAQTLVTWWGGLAAPVPVVGLLVVSIGWDGVARVCLEANKVELFLPA